MLTESMIRRWLSDGQEHRFYTSRAWRHTREQVMELDKRECQECKAHGRYSKATTVHHINHLKDRPDLALSIWDTLPGGELQRNLIALCENCHKKQHPEQLRQFQPKKFLTAERW